MLVLWSVFGVPLGADPLVARRSYHREKWCGFVRFMQSGKEREDLVITKSKQGIPPHWKERLARLKQTMLADLSQQGITDAEIEGMKLNFEGEERSDFTAFWYLVQLKDQSQRLYRVDGTGVSVNGFMLGSA